MRTRYSSDDRAKVLYDNCKEKDDMRIENSHLNIDEDEVAFQEASIDNLYNALNENSMR